MHILAQLRIMLRMFWCCRRLKPAGTTGKKVQVAYAHQQYPVDVPDKNAVMSGGAVKYNYLAAAIPHSGMTCNILYVVSSSHVAGMSQLMKTARSRGIRVVWNQNGAFFPSAYGREAAAKGNAQMAPLLHAADYVFYQSKFARDASDYFLGPRKQNSEILYNAVDTDLFSPRKVRLDKELVLLVAGSHNDTYRLPLAIEAMKLVLKQRERVRMIVAGRMTGQMMAAVQRLIDASGLNGLVEFVRPYTQQAAPEIFSRAHIFLHTQYNDVCPSVVIEAMACGLPVVYSRSGGTPELVGEEAGYGVPSILDWETPRPPNPRELADGIFRISANWSCYSEAARERAVSMFDLKPWIKRHIQIFEKLMEL